MRVFGGKRLVITLCLASCLTSLGLLAPGVASAHATANCAGAYVFGPIKLRSIGSQTGGVPLYLGEHGGQAIMYTGDNAPTQEWTGYRDANCALVLYNGTSNLVLTAAVGAHCYLRFADCVTAQPFSKGDVYQEWTRNVYGTTWVIRLLDGVGKGKALADPHAGDILAAPSVLSGDRDTNKAVQWQAG